MNHYRSSAFIICLLLACSFSRADEIPLNLKKENLVAWCIVPFDAKKRGPAERAEMLKDLGLGSSAYDWRKQHIGEFEEEILEYKSKGIEFFAFWGGHENAYSLFKKHGIQPQIWRTAPSPEADSQEEKVTAAANSLEPLAKEVTEAGSSLGLYNHGGWGGHPDNLIAVCAELRKRGYPKVGIVYNWHHAHDLIDQWGEVIEKLKPYLLCLNLNGMNDNAQPKILPLAQGAHEKAMLETLLRSKYSGPVGILDHRNETDTRLSLQDNLDGLTWLLKEISEPGSGGDKPTPKAKDISKPQ